MTGAGSDMNDEEVKVYPNQAGDQLNIRMDDIGQTRVLILDHAGRQVLSTMIYGSGIIDLSGLAPGVYFSRISNKSVSLTRKFIKSK